MNGVLTSLLNSGFPKRRSPLPFDGHSRKAQKYARTVDYGRGYQSFNEDLRAVSTTKAAE
jgi:hypothetical protein